MIKGVLLDIDGTLVLSNDAHARSWVAAFAHFDYEIAYYKVRRLIGMGGDKLMPQLVPGLESESENGQQISNYRSKIFLDKYALKLKPAPGSRALIKRLQKDGLKLMIASSAKDKELKSLLQAAHVDDLLREATTSDDVDNSKPDPDIVHAALTKIGLPPQQVLMLGDTPYDLEAVSKAGLALIALRCGGWNDKDLAGALAMYNDPADLLDHYETSPLTE